MRSSVIKCCSWRFIDLKNEGKRYQIVTADADTDDTSAATAALN
jgi:hypothetical protein